MKTCTGECGLTLPLKEFGPGGKGPDGKQPRCRKCLAAQKRRQRAAKPASPIAQVRLAQQQEKTDLATRGLKRCARSECRKVLPVEQFFVNTHTADGRYAYCRDCCQAIDAARRPKMPYRPLTYTAVHQQLPSIKGRPCRHCRVPAEQWAYDHADPDELTCERGPYSLKPDHYMPLCRSCHSRFDLEYRRKTGTAKPRGYARRLKPCAVCQQGFWNPSHHRKTCSPTCETALRSRSQRERKARLTGRIVAELRAITPGRLGTGAA